MKRINLLLFCSALCIGSLIAGCSTERTEWINRGEWVYNNASTHTIEITGVYTGMQFGADDSFTLLPGESHTVDVRSDGPKELPAEDMPFPLGFTSYGRSSIIVDGETTAELQADKGICDRSRYEVEKLGRAHYRFTCTITDKIIEELITE